MKHFKRKTNTQTDTYFNTLIKWREKIKTKYFKMYMKLNKVK